MNPRITALRKLFAEATPGPWPWEWDSFAECGDIYAGIPGDSPGVAHDIENRKDIEFIAASRTVLPLFVDFFAEVEEMHKRCEIVSTETSSCPDYVRSRGYRHCTECGISWPCPTARLTQELLRKLGE